MKRTFAFALALCLGCTIMAQKKYELTSPDRQVKATVSVGEQLTYNLGYGNETLLDNCTAGMEVRQKRSWDTTQNVVRSQPARTSAKQFTPVVPLKYATVNDNTTTNCY